MDEPFGWALQVDVFGCPKDLLESEEHIAAFAVELCDDVLKMKRFGEPQVPWFGESEPKTAGYSLVQLIETSSVTGHFSGERNAAYLDIFSCRPYDPDAAIEFAQRHFQGERTEWTFNKRS